MSVPYPDFSSSVPRCTPIARKYCGDAKRAAALSLSALVLAAGLAGCGSVSSALFPDDPKAPASAPPPPGFVQAPQAGTGQFTAVAIAPGAPTGTQQGQIIAAVRAKLVALTGQLSQRNVSLSNIRQAIATETGNYRAARSELARSVAGGGSPAATSADQALRRMNEAVDRMKAEIAVFAAGSAQANGLMSQLERVNPEGEEDRAQLNRLRSEVLQTSTALDALVNGLANEEAQNNAFAAKERANLAAILQSRGVQPGSTAPAPGIAAAPLQPAAGATQPALNRTAFVTIKFDRPNVVYRDALSAALQEAIKRRPDAGFEVVGVSPDASQGGLELVRARAEDVSRTMMELGVPAAKVSLGAAALKTLGADEVRIFLK